MGHHHHNDGHHHAHGHDHHPPGHGPGHNHPHAADHLHSHVHGTSERERTEELLVLATNFVDGFREADDKTSWLRQAGVPLQRQGADGLTMNLVDVAIVANWQIGTASPAFASRELVYLPFPGSMVNHRENMTFANVSLTERADIDLLELLGDRLDTERNETHD